MQESWQEGTGSGGCRGSRACMLRNKTMGMLELLGLCTVGLVESLRLHYDYGWPVTYIYTV